MFRRFVFFGAGDFGKRCIDLVGEAQVAYVVDNDKGKRNPALYPPVFSFAEKKKEMQGSEHEIVVAVSEKYAEEILQQFREEGITNYCTFREFQRRLLEKRIAQRTDYIGIYRKAVGWIQGHTVQDTGIINNTSLRRPYPEVTGYYIPSLLRWGYREMAISYAKWLCSIQKEDGSWYDTEDTAPYVFDTAQILKGLIATRELLPEVDGHIRRGCEWILGNMRPNGRLTTPTQDAWGDARTCSELIHVYCLSPLMDAGRIFGETRYEEAAQKILSYYVENHREEMENFSLLSHFYAYVMEGLIDMGREDIARKGMENLAAYQKEDGSVPGYCDVNWICSTGLFQLALVWFRLGNAEHGNKAFSYACKLQNESGGWYGSYLHPDFPNEQNDYFPVTEISWANKYFLDALYWKNRIQFDNKADSFLSTIGKQDGRYVIVKEEISALTDSDGKGGDKCIIDIGCGRGRYLKNLIEDLPYNRYYAVDISLKVMIDIDTANIEKWQGSLTDIPLPDNAVNIAYTCEALEHAVDTKSAVREMARVVAPGGKIVIIDKPKDLLGCMEIEEWEQWFDVDELKSIMSEFCSSVTIERNVSYEDNAVPGLFVAWIGTVK